MKTVWGEQLDPNAVLQEYPRPQMMRESYRNLNGLWDYAITDTDTCPENWDGKILVPFSPEAELSGVGRTLLPGQYLWYRRELAEMPQARMRLLLHFGAVDQECRVWLNGRLLGGHTGGYTAFTLDATDALAESNVLLVAVRDGTDTNELSRGKQKTKRGGIWYTPQSGIWQTVWAEWVPERYISALRITPDAAHSCVRVTVQSEYDGVCYLHFHGRRIGGFTNRETTIRVENAGQRPRGKLLCPARHRRRQGQRWKAVPAAQREAVFPQRRARSGLLSRRAVYRAQRRGDDL